MAWPRRWGAIIALAMLLAGTSLYCAYRIAAPAVHRKLLASELTATGEWLWQCVGGVDFMVDRDDPDDNLFPPRRGKGYAASSRDYLLWLVAGGLTREQAHHLPIVTRREKWGQKNGDMIVVADT